MRILKSVILFFSLILCIIWVSKGYFIGKTEMNDDFNKVVQGKVIGVYKKNDEKFCRLKFNDSSEYQTTFFAIQNRIEVGDSIYKASKSFKFIIYHKGVQNDTSIYDGRNLLFK